ncbi:hypothetical protein QFZ33_001958 [Arthrobacter globiformis]|nr:hypothetical protein [Arthrobacter globiformis]
MGLLHAVERPGEVRKGGEAALADGRDDAGDLLLGVCDRLLPCPRHRLAKFGQAETAAAQVNGAEIDDGGIGACGAVRRCGHPFILRADAPRPDECYCRSLLPRAAVPTVVVRVLVH